MKTIINMLQLFEIGDVIYGYCNGFFNADCNDKTCILINPKYVVFENKEGFATILNFEESLTEELINSWKRKNDDKKDFRLWCW